MKKLYLLLPIFLVVVSVSGCTINLGGPAKTVDPNTTGGIFRTADNGATWQQLGKVPTVNNQDLNLFGLDTSVITPDPSDKKTFYLGTFGDGLFYTYDSGATWQIARSYGQKAVVDVAVDPKNKCNIYVAAVGRVFQSLDCTRSWKEIYSDNDKVQLIYSVVIDHFNSDIIYIATARGDVIKSVDAVQTWKVVKSFNSTVKKLLMDPSDSRLLIAAVDGKGLFKTTNGGTTWEDLSPQLKEIQANKGFRDLVSAPSAKGFYFLAVNNGLFKTANYGEDWTEVNLISQENRSNINALAISPFSEQAIYYVTNNTFYATVDGGKTWSSRKLPTSRQGSRLLASPINNNAVYLGVKTQ